MDSKNDSDDDLPEINFRSDSPNRSGSSKNDFEMPEADVLLAQRLRLAKQIKDIQLGKETIEDVTFVETLEENELDDMETQITIKNPGFMPKLPLDPLHTILKPLQLVFLEKFVKSISSDTTNVENVVDFVLESLEETQDDGWESDDIVVVGCVLSIICTSEVCAHLLRHLSRSRTLLYHVIQEICTDALQVIEMGKAVTKLMTKPEHRIEFVTLLEGREGDYVRILIVGIIRKCLDELLLGYASEEWITSPYTVNVLLPLVTQKWGQLQFNQQLLLTELLSKNLKQLENFSDNNENIVNDAEERMKLLMVLGSNIARASSVNQRCKLQILVSRMQIYQSKFEEERREDDEFRQYIY